VSNQEHNRKNRQTSRGDGTGGEGEGFPAKKGMRQHDVFLLGGRKKGGVGWERVTGGDTGALFWGETWAGVSGGERGTRERVVQNQ